MVTRRFALIFLVFFVISCGRNEKVPFELSDKVHLSDYNMISPFLIEQLNEPPLKYPSAWNDSLLKLTGIHAIKISAKGMKNPDDPSESILFRYDENGRLTGFEQMRFDLSKEPFTTLSFSGKTGRLTRYFGENVQQELKCITLQNRLIFTRNRSPKFIDSTIMYGSVQKPSLIIEKSGKFLSRINVILEESEPVRKFGSVVASLNLTPSEIGNAEKIVTYVDDNYRPIRSYLLTEELIQTAMTAEWIYENHKKPVACKKYVNGSLVKEYTFNYSEDKLLRSFIFNRISYQAEYR